MKRDAIMKLIKDLAKSQGLYGRILESIQNLTEHQFDELMNHLEKQSFSDAVDFILYIEG